MQSNEALDTSCCSARLVQPFLQLLASDRQLPPAALRDLGRLGVEDRVPLTAAHHWLSAAVACTEDPALGIKAGALLSTGDLGVIDYVMCSSPTVGGALEAAVRYLRLLDEALEGELQARPVQEPGAAADHTRTALRLSSLVAMPASGEDFLLSAFWATQPWLARVPGLEVWFAHAAPAQLEPYQTTFGGARCRFSAPHAGFVFAREHLSLPLERADARLNEIVRKLADIMRSELPSDNRLFRDRVRALLQRELSAHDLTATWVARRLHVSVRTLARKLDAEGTSFFALLDETRRVRALQLIKSGNMPLAELAFELGFAHVASFHRAFKRWTGRSPAAYRFEQVTGTGAPAGSAISQRTSYAT